MNLKKIKLDFSAVSIYQTKLKKYVDGLTEENRKKIVGYAYIILTLFTVSFFGIFAIRPTIATVSNLQKQYDDNNLVLESLQKKLSALQSLDNQYNGAVQNDLIFVYAAIPQTSKVAFLTRQLEELVYSKSLSLIKLDFGTVEIYPNKKTVGPIYAFPFNLSVEGEEENINLFLADIINFDRIVELDRVITGKAQSGKFSITVTGIVFFSDE